jgi:hypothetical protein
MALSQTSERARWPNCSAQSFELTQDLEGCTTGRIAQQTTQRYFASRINRQIVLLFL